MTHHSEKCPGKIESENAKTVKIQSNKFLRKVRESLEIQKNDCHFENGGMNQDIGQYVTTKFWLPYMKYLRNPEER